MEAIRVTSAGVAVGRSDAMAPSADMPVPRSGAGSGSQPSIGGAELDRGAPLVEVRAVSKRFGETRALEKCSLTAEAGEIHALVGENGSGKSTLAKLLSGVFSPDDGSIVVAGGAPSSPRVARRLGVSTVFQEVLVCEGRSVLENLFLGHDGFLRSRRSRAARYRDGGSLLSRLLDSKIDLDMPIDGLSLSARQWVVIARALLGDPKVVIFDEASAALDQSSAKRLLDEMVAQREQGRCVLFVTHRISELRAVADRVTVLRDGTDVGTLERDEISEERLLEMMTGKAVARQRSARSSVVTANPVVEVDSLEVEPGRPFSLTLRHGEILGVAGLEGHGQAQFVRALAGIERAIGGQVRAVDGDRLASIRSIRDADRAGVVYVTGDRKREGVISHLSVIENFSLPLLRRQARAGIIDRRRMGAEYHEQTAALAVKTRSDSMPIGTLSGGNQQKILIGRALALAPSVMVLNDPTRGVDIGTKQDVYGLLETLAANGTSVVFLSTELEEFVGLADRVAVFHNGGLENMVDGDEISVEALLAAMFGRRQEAVTGAPREAKGDFK